METETIKEKIAQLRASYTKLALTCRAAGIRVNQATVENYLQRIKQLEGQQEVIA